MMRQSVNIKSSSSPSDRIATNANCRAGGMERAPPASSTLR
jgi:hypothetical protein